MYVRLCVCVYIYIYIYTAGRGENNEPTSSELVSARSLAPPLFHNWIAPNSSPEQADKQSLQTSYCPEGGFIGIML